MPHHRVALLVDLCAGEDLVPLAVEHDIRPEAWNVGLLRHRHAAFDFDAVASVQHDGVLTITVGLQRRDAVLLADECTADAWSSVVPADCSTEFRLELPLAVGSAIAHGVVVHDVVAADDEPLPERRKGRGP